jgi:hypothetical protein
MLYDGKRIDELSKDEMEAAAVYLTRRAQEARQVIEEAQDVVNRNLAGLAELAIAYERFLPCNASRLN